MQPKTVGLQPTPAQKERQGAPLLDIPRLFVCDTDSYRCWQGTCFRDFRSRRKRRRCAVLSFQVRTRPEKDPCGFSPFIRRRFECAFEAFLRSKQTCSAIFLTYIAIRPHSKIPLSKRFETYGSNPPRRYRVAAVFCGENGCSWNTVPVWRDAVGVSEKKRRIPKEARLCLLWASLGGEPKVLGSLDAKPKVSVQAQALSVPAAIPN